MSEAKENIGYKDIFRQKEYMKMILAALINRFGDSVDAIASAWIVYELTENAAWSAIIFAVNKIPTIVITPLAGAWVEGRNKKRIMVVSDLIRAVCVALVATGYLFGFLNAWILLLTNFVISTVEAFRGPANTAFTPKVLERKYYEYGMSLMASLSSVVELIGMAIASGIIAWIGTAGAIYVDMATFVLSALIISFVKVKEQKQQKQKFAVGEYLHTLQDGMKYAVNNKILLFFVGVAVFLNGILVPFNSLQAPLATEILKGGAEVMSILGIVITLSMLVGSVVYPVISTKMGERFVVGFAGLMIAAFYFGLVLCRPLYENRFAMYAVVAVLSFFLGVAASLFNSYASIQMMKVIEEEYLARVGALFGAATQLAAPVVSFLISIVLGYFSTAWIFILAGIADLLFVAIVLNSRILRKKLKAEQEIPATSI